MHIKIKGVPTVVDLVRPSSFTERLDVGSVVATNPQRALCAALGLCWPRVRRRLRYGGDPLAYGGQVLDQLMTEGADLGDVMDVAGEALTLCMSELPTQAGVDAAVGNSGAPAGGST